MNKSMILIGTTLFAGLGLVASNALAVDYSWVGGSTGNWSADANWSGSGVPDGTDDTATINPGSAVTVTMDGDYTVGELVIGKLATLNVQGTKTLTLDKGAGSENGRLTIHADASNFGVLNIRNNGTFTFVNNDNMSPYHQIGGQILLNGAGSDLKITTDSVTFNPYNDGSSDWIGFVVGENPSAQFLIDAGLTVTNNVAFAGMMTIQEGAAGTDPVFNNQHEVRADVADVLTFESDITLNDDSSAVWYAWASSSAVLLFKKDATGLVGEFRLDDCATIKLTEGVDITTTGNLKDGLGTGVYDGYVHTCGDAGGSNTSFDAGNISPITNDIAEGASCSAASCP